MEIKREIIDAGCITDEKLFEGCFKVEVSQPFWTDQFMTTRYKDLNVALYYNDTLIAVKRVQHRSRFNNHNIKTYFKELRTEFYDVIRGLRGF